jgi:adenosylhomocysteine nucleosidase
MTVCVIVSANAEWQAVRALYPAAACGATPYGEFFDLELPGGQSAERVVALHGGWGKISAAASAQYALDRWSPSLVVNLGTCGGFAGEVEPGTVLLVERTLVYDILEQMGDPQAALAHYATTLDLDWVGPTPPTPVRRSLLVSADRDLVSGELAGLRQSYGAIAGDWESGAIAFVCQRNRVPCLILRGVSDVVSDERGEAYGNAAIFHQRTRVIMADLFAALPLWLAHYFAHGASQARH